MELKCRSELMQSQFPPDGWVTNLGVSTYRTGYDWFSLDNAKDIAESIGTFGWHKYGPFPSSLHHQHNLRSWRCCGRGGFKGFEEIAKWEPMRDDR